TVIARWGQALRARPDDLLRAVQLHMLHAGLPASDFHGRLRQVAGAAELPAPQATANTVVFECEDDAIIAPATRARVRARYPKARHLAQAQGGHYPHIVKAELLVERMRDWLQ
ncbi:alpha/beta fold hydrolase, partial [Variovorax sp. CT11-76]